MSPAQSASRPFLSQHIPPGHKGEVFSLYRTTGHPMTWLALLMFTPFIGVGSQLMPFYGPTLTAVITGVGNSMLPVHEQTQY